MRKGHGQKWFVAEAIFHATIRVKQGNKHSLTEDLLFLVRAADRPAAVIKAEAIAKGKEHSYDNEKGRRVSWNFIRLVELTEMIDQRLIEGAEIKSSWISSFCCGR